MTNASNATNSLRRLLALVAALAAVALLGAGCSSSTNQGSPLGGPGSKPTSPKDKGATQQSTPVAEGTTTTASGDTKGGGAAAADLKPYAGDDFYSPPNPLPKGDHGTLIRYQPIDDVRIGASSKVYRILYRSESLVGDPIAVSGTAVVPTAKAPAEGRKIVTLAHGTTGIADECAPSKDPGGEISLLGPLVNKGFMIAATDYEGLGTPGRHPYLVGESEGRGVLDAVRAAGSLPEANPGRRVAIAGYSQGGHGALWAEQLAGEWTPDLKIMGTFAGAPASEIEVILAAAPRLPAPGFAYMLIAGLAAANPEADPATFLTPKGLTMLDLVDQGCVAQVLGAFAGQKADTLIRPDGPSSPPWKRLAQNDDAGQTKTSDPTLIIQSKNDDVVPVIFSQMLLARMCANGQTVQRRVLADGGGHTAAAVPAYKQAVKWIEARFDPNATPATSSCGAP